MTSALLLVSGLLVLVLVCSWNSKALPDQDNLESSGQEEQLDPIPDPAGGFCQRNKNPKGLGFIGVKYDLIRGNPEGKTSLGGADPGLGITKKILKLTNDNGNAVPDQICYEDRQLCTMSKSSKIFGGTKRYQKKLKVDVTAEAGYSGLFDFSFSLSAKYEEVKESTQSGETVFRDCTEICNKGEARYQLGSVESNQWTLTDEFATDVCQLTVKYKTADQKQKYFDFLKTWGTHVVVQVVLGTKKITRFKSSLKEFMTYASENVGASVSVSGGYGGATGSISVDVNKFETSEETKKEFGDKQLTYTIGGDDLPEPIQMKLMGIEETLEPKFWSNLDELKKKSPCRRMSLTKLGKCLKNMRKTIEDYPIKLGLKRATDNSMQLQLSWPSGYYSLFAAKIDGKNVCPQESVWQPGSVTDLNHVYFNATNGKLIGIERLDFRVGFGVKYGFCSKTQHPGRSYFSPKWPKGKYCILRKSIDPGNPKCPENFEVASVEWNDFWKGNRQAQNVFLKAPVKEGTYPDGSFGSERHLKIDVCCRQDGFVATGISLPLENPFIMMNVQGYSCQKVCGAKETPVAVKTGALVLPFTTAAPDSAIHGKVKPAGTTFKQMVKLRFCHYQKMDDANFFKLKLVTTSMKARKAERECKAKGGHLVSIHSQAEKDKVKEIMGNEGRVWIGLHRRTVRNRPWVWYDDTELDFGEWKPDDTDDENYVSMSKDGSWKAMTNDNKLPFVCKLINHCPLSK